MTRSTAWRQTMHARGACPGCERAHDGPAQFCFACRLAQSRRARAWYQRNRVRALAAARRRRMSFL
jgi:hypothetical protein